MTTSTSVKPARVTFETLPYELSHGRSPRGRGSWAFAPFHLRNANDYIDFCVFSPGGMTITQAKAWFRVRLAELRTMSPARSCDLAEVWAVMP